MQDGMGEIEMAKNKRGKALWRMPARGRGTCPVCSATRIKLLYTRVLENGDTATVCKRCRSKQK
jgi:hypothetical protein